MAWRRIACVLLVACGGCGKSSNAVGKLPGEEVRHTSGRAKTPATPPAAPLSPQTLMTVNSIPVYSTPEQVQRAFRRVPDNVEQNGDNLTQFYQLNAATGETLKLTYREGRLIGKTVIRGSAPNAAAPAAP